MPIRCSAGCCSAPSFCADAGAGRGGSANHGRQGLQSRSRRASTTSSSACTSSELFLNRLTSALDPVRAGDVHTDHRQQQVPRPLCDGVVHCGTIALPPAGFQDYLYRFGQTPPVTYSDINGYGPFLQPLIWFRLYWADCRTSAGSHHQPVLGAGHGEQLARAHESGGRQILAILHRGSGLCLLLMAWRRQLYFLQHSRSQSRIAPRFEYRRGRARNTRRSTGSIGLCLSLALPT